MIGLTNTLPVYSNTNYIHNWRFKVNQRGQSSYSIPYNISENPHVDRWFQSVESSTATVTVLDSGIQISAPTNAMWCNLIQYVNSAPMLAGRLVTLSAEIVSATVGTPIWFSFFVNGAWLLEPVALRYSSPTIHSFTVQLPATLSDVVKVGLTFGAMGTYTVTIASVKLEFGPISTLYLDSPNTCNYAEQLSICQRFVLFPTCYVYRAMYVNADYCDSFIPTPSPLSAIPLFDKLSLTTLYHSSTGVGTASGFTYGVPYVEREGFVLRASRVSHGYSDLSILINSGYVYTGI